MDMKDIIINNKARLLRCQDGNAYYALSVPYSEMLYSFPVPLHTMHEKTLATESYTIRFIDHIHKAICEGTLIKEAA